ncbi:MAG: flagellar basal-body MS-ring/collar protein FliF [Acidobacteriota bacterium]
MAGSALSQLSALNKSLTLNQKLSIVGLGVVILFGVLLFGYLVQRQPYQLLFSDLDASNANSVVEQLKQLGIPYELANGGRSILVPADRVSETRLELASQSLPKSGRIGLELFDQNNWGISDFAQKVNYTRALEGELERTFLSLSEVSGARVHLVMQKDSLFEEDSQPAKASVVIKLNSTATLGKRKVAAIRNLVAFAVEGLDAKNVTLVDVSGNLLSEPPAEDESLTTAQVGLRQKAEKEVCDKVRAILAPIVGEGNVRVSASVQMDFSQTTEKSESIQDPIIISQQVSKELVNSPEQQGIPFKRRQRQAGCDGGRTGNGNAGPASSGNGADSEPGHGNGGTERSARRYPDGRERLVHSSAGRSADGSDSLVLAEELGSDSPCTPLSAHPGGVRTLLSDDLSAGEEPCLLLRGGGKGEQSTAGGVDQGSRTAEAARKCAFRRSGSRRR